MVSAKKSCSGFTLIELMMVMVIGLFMSLTMMSYFTSALRSSTILNAETLISEKSQQAMSVLSQSVREAGSGNPANSDVPFYIGACESWDPCTNNGAGVESDRMAVLLNPEDDRDCTGSAVAAFELIANVFYVKTSGGISTLFCRGFSIDSLAWVDDEVPIADGIENMQVLYRVVNPDNGRQQYKSADKVPSVGGDLELGWDAVRSVSLSLLVSNGTNVRTPDTPENQSFQLADSDTQNFNDQVLRREFSSNEIVLSKIGL